MSDNEGVLEKQATSSEILLYQTEDGKSKVEVRLENEMVWLSQKMLSELFQVSISTINEHIKNIFKEGELHEEAVIRNFRITASDNKTYLTNYVVNYYKIFIQMMILLIQKFIKSLNI